MSIVGQRLTIRPPDGEFFSHRDPFPSLCSP
jgi:hypothetical protein